LTPGSYNDLTTLWRVLSTLEGGMLYGDKSYVDASLRERLCEKQNLTLLTPVKQTKGQSRRSAAVEGRQPRSAIH